MSNYTPVTNFASKDALVSGNALKALKGAEFTTEFTAVQTALNTKFDGAVQFAPDGTVTQPSFGFTNNNGTGMYNVAGVLNFATNQLQRISLSASGNVTVNSPASGTTLTLNNAAGVVMLSATDGTQTFQTYTSAGNVWFGATSSSQVNLLVNNAAKLTISTAGAVAITTPTSNVSALTVNAAVISAANDRAMAIAGTSTDVRLGIGSTTSGNAQLNLDTFGAANWVLGNNRTDSSFRISNSQALGTTDRLTISSTGLVAIPAPSNGVTLSLTSTSGTTGPMIDCINGGSFTSFLRVGTNFVGTGTATATLGGVKPGSNTTNSQWLSVLVGATQYYIPMWQ